MNTVSRIACVLSTVLAFPIFTPAHVQRGVDESAPARDRTFVVAAGDSTVEGHGAHKVEAWPARLEVACGADCRVRNVGHGGSCVVVEECIYPLALTESFADEVLALQPDLVLVGTGRNDLCRAPTATLIGGYEDLRRQARAAGVPIRFATITPAGSQWAYPCEEQRIELNEWMRTLPGTLDFEARVSTPRGLLRHGYDSGDGLHPNAVGYAALGAYAERVVGGQIARIAASHRRS